MFLFLKFSYISKFWPEALSVKNPRRKKPKWKTMPSQGFELKRWSLRKNLKKFRSDRGSNWEPLNWKAAALPFHHGNLIMERQNRIIKCRKGYVRFWKFLSDFWKSIYIPRFVRPNLKEGGKKRIKKILKNFKERKKTWPGFEPGTSCLKWSDLIGRKTLAWTIFLRISA